MSSTAPALVRWTRQLEESHRLDRAVRAVEPEIRAVFGTRVGVVHAASVAASAGVYVGSWVARTKGRHRLGAGLSLAGFAVAGASAYLGGHLAIGRKVGTQHPAFAASPSGTLARS